VLAGTHLNEGEVNRATTEVDDTADESESRDGQTGKSVFVRSKRWATHIKDLTVKIWRAAEGWTNTVVISGNSTPPKLVPTERHLYEPENKVYQHEPGSRA
jgi:hypothetical protein